MTVSGVDKRPLVEGSQESSKKAKVGQNRSITDFFSKTAGSKKVTEEKKTDEVETKASQVLQKSSEEPIETLNTIGLSEFKKRFVANLKDEQKELLDLEINTIEDSWFEALADEFTKPYFLTLKRFLSTQWKAKQTIFPPQNDIYSWSRLTPLNKVKVLILGQDPYHNFNQAHGLAFSVKSPTPPPPSLKNMYKALQIDYPKFKIPTGPGSGDLTKWADQGVLMLNACLTVKAHEANSHAKRGWEQFTEVVIKKVIANDRKVVLLLWGTPAQKRIAGLKIDQEKIHVLKAVHPSPLSARRGYFEANHYIKTNTWLIDNGEEPIDWALVPGNNLDLHEKKCV